MTQVELRRDGTLATLTLNRPEARNALSIELCDEIGARLAELATDRDVRVLVIRGEGPVFCSGADFSAVSDPDPLRFLKSFERMLEAVARCHVPTIAEINGAALGGGLQLATVCDFRVAGAEARIGIPSSRLGIVVNFENVRRLVLLVGSAVAKEILMRARTYSGTEAAEVGLINESVPGAELSGRVSERAMELGELAPLSVQGAKRAIQAVLDDVGAVRKHSPWTAEEIDTLMEQAYESEDLADGLAAMRAKRAPRWSGK